MSGVPPRLLAVTVLVAVANGQVLTDPRSERCAGGCAVETLARSVEVSSLMGYGALSECHVPKPSRVVRRPCSTQIGTAPRVSLG